MEVAHEACTDHGVGPRLERYRLCGVLLALPVVGADTKATAARPSRAYFFSPSSPLNSN